MKNKDLLKFCRYYKGEDENPFSGCPQFYIWVFEKDWVNEMGPDNVVSENLSLVLLRYISAGYADFEKHDDIPITLKAMLYLLMEKWNESIVTKDAFADFYNKWLHRQI